VTDPVAAAAAVMAKAENAPGRGQLSAHRARGSSGERGAKRHPHDGGDVRKKEEGYRNMNIVGKRFAIYYTPEEMVKILPVDQYQKSRQVTLYGFIGEVTGEMSVGIWLRIDEVWAGSERIRKVDLGMGAQYFIPWAELRRAILLEQATTDSARPPGLYL
jgi:hypothetical protein